jgi:hypothetical protein
MGEKIVNVKQVDMEIGLGRVSLSPCIPSIPMDNGGMDADLQHVVATLAEISDPELHALIDATYRVTRIAPGLLAWIGGVAKRPLTGADPERPELTAGSMGHCNIVLSLSAGVSNPRVFLGR